jgi:F-type H+-transporting ATPase subunit epsilon
MEKFALQIISPERVVYRGEVTSLTAPGMEGYLGIWARHAPMLAALKIGEAEIQEGEGRRRHFAIAGGLLEVERDEVTLLADAAESAEEIDVSRAEEAKKRAEERLSHPNKELDITRSQAALMRSMSRLRVAARQHSR